jgi:hypothetical protein
MAALRPEGVISLPFVASVSLGRPRIAGTTATSDVVGQDDPGWMARTLSVELKVTRSTKPKAERLDLLNAARECERLESGASTVSLEPWGSAILELAHYG